MQNPCLRPKLLPYNHTVSYIHTTYPFWFLQCLFFEQLEALICRRNGHPLWWPIPLLLGTAEVHPGAGGCVQRERRRTGSLGDGSWHRRRCSMVLLRSRAWGRGRGRGWGWCSEGGENGGSRLLLYGLLRGSHCQWDTRGRLDCVPCDNNSLSCGYPVNWYDCITCMSARCKIYWRRSTDRNVSKFYDMWSTTFKFSVI